MGTNAFRYAVMVKMTTLGATPVR